LDVGVVEVSNNVDAGQVIATTTKLHLRFLIVPGNSGSRMGCDTLRNGESLVITASMVSQTTLTI
jgi:hypothetical protein